MTAPPAVRCSVASRAADESPTGTASTVRAFVLLEAPGPWGVDALRDSRLPEEVKARLRGLAGSGVRPLLVRRPGRSDAAGPRLFAAAGGRLWSTVLDDVRALLDVDLGGLREGSAPSALSAQEEPVFLVCTHGRHDACCAEWGRPLAAALLEAAPDQVWEVSHIGGDRFAPNVLVLPDGLYYGRLEPSDAAGFVAEHRAGRLDLAHLRGRSTLPFAVQAAEIHLRRHLDDRRLPAYPLVEHRRAASPDETVKTTAVFEVDTERWQVQVTSRPSAPRLLTCRSVREDVAPVHELVAVTRLHPA